MKSDETAEMQGLVQSYFAWMKDRTTVKSVGSSWLEITTPYLDRHNDYLVIFAKKEGGVITLCDDGAVIDDLVSSGCNLEGQRQKGFLNTVLNRFGVSCSNGTLFVEAEEKNFAFRKQDLVQAMLSLGDMAYLASPMATNPFLDEVAAWLDLLGVRYIADLKLTGKTGYDYAFDMAIPKSKDNPERIIQTIGIPTKDKISRLIFQWSDTKDRRKNETTLIAILNDTRGGEYTRPVAALASYKITSVLWSERQQAQAILAS